MASTASVLSIHRPSRGGVSVTRALGSSTRAGIFEHLQEAATELTVRDIAASFDLHPNVARTHLETLAEAGLVTVGQRKHPGGGRPAKVYLARDDVELSIEPDVPPAGVGAALVVRLLTTLLDDAPLRVPPGRTLASARAARAHEVAAAEARKLMTAAQVGHPSPATLEDAALLVVRALRPVAPGVRVVKAGREWVDVAGCDEPFRLLADSRPELADALERGLLIGAFTGAGFAAALTEAGTLPGGSSGHAARVWRARGAPGTGGRTAVDPSATIDTRGLQREAGVVRAMRAVTGLRAGDVLEVLAEGPGSPAAFARWADRAGHVLLGVERATDGAGRSAIRLLIRKGA